MTKPDLDYELWGRIEDRREVTLVPELTPHERKLMSLALSLARLSAQRDIQAESLP